ncbi:putative coactivator CBP, KIX domain superfamily [Fagus crenata]
MPGPSPRPYECVRKAWHSDRHQPIRGSLIQEIFRVVNEVHSSTTKKNKEWQEKLPVAVLAVLKAEEIIYSKANSEVEFWRWVSQQWNSGEESGGGILEIG